MLTKERLETLSRSPVKLQEMISRRDIRVYVIMVHNLFLILGQGLYYISLKKYFKPKDMIKNYRLDLGLVIFFLTIFSKRTYSTSCFL